MTPPHFLTIAEQVAQYLRNELLRGRWGETIPGVNQLAPELGVNDKTVEVAMRILEKEGLLVAQGAGRRRRIALPAGNKELPGLRVALMMLDVSARGEDVGIELRHSLEEAGHLPFYPEKTLLDLGMHAGRIARFAKRAEADAWVVGAGSKEVLKWFSEQPVPTFALFGRWQGIPIAAVRPDKPPAIAELTRQLIELGHRRISLLCRRQLRVPEPGRAISAFLGELDRAGIQVGDFNLPDWKENKEGFGDVLDSLFQVTPPTALILDEPFLYSAAHHFLSKRGLRVPEDVSLVCTDADPSFAWCEPSVAHISWDHRPVVRRVVRWIANVARGKEDLRQTITKAEAVDGGTVGPAPKS